MIVSVTETNELVQNLLQAKQFFVHWFFRR